MASQKDSARLRPLTQVLKDLRHCLDQWSGELLYNAFFGDPTLNEDWEGLYDRTLACETRLARGLDQLRAPLDEFRQTILLAHAACEGWAEMAQRLSRLTKHPGAARALETLHGALDRPEYSLPESVLAQDERFSTVIRELRDALGVLRRSFGPEIADIRVELERKTATEPRLHAAIDQSQAELAKAKEELERAASSRAELETDLSKALARAGEMRRQADEDILRRDEQARRDSELRRKLEQEAGEATRNLIALEGQLAAARRQLQQAGPEPDLLKKLESSEAESARLRASLEQAHAQADKAADQERALDQARQESQDLQHQLERAKARIAKLSAELEAAFRGEKPPPQSVDQ